MLSDLILLLHSALLFFAASFDSDSPTVSLDCGVFQGSIDGNLSKFLGVPFARPSLPSLSPACKTLQSSAPPAPSRRLQVTPIAIFFDNNYTSISESCLTLDVFTPTSAHPRSTLPVLVWIYGGGFVVGNSANTDVRPTVEGSILLNRSLSSF
ncbi:Alpha/Beta hydrolase protein [Mycena galericulata]|nr:Alpha/Beta hydrolase protein [Mycena galericulata]